VTVSVDFAMHQKGRPQGESWRRNISLRCSNRAQVGKKLEKRKQREGEEKLERGGGGGQGVRKNRGSQDV